jgi:hypothetical protein
MSKYSAIALAILGLIIAVGPYVLYRICDESMAGPCNDTGHAEILIGASIAVLSVSMLFMNDGRRRMCLGFAVLALSVLSVLVVTTIIGTCDSGMMACNRTGKPGMIATGTIAAMVSVVNVVLIKRDSRMVRWALSAFPTGA